MFFNPFNFGRALESLSDGGSCQVKGDRAYSITEGNNKPNNPVIFLYDSEGKALKSTAIRELTDPATTRPAGFDHCAGPLITKNNAAQISEVSDKFDVI